MDGAGPEEVARWRRRRCSPRRGGPKCTGVKSLLQVRYAVRLAQVAPRSSVPKKNDYVLEGVGLIKPARFLYTVLARRSTRLHLGLVP